MQRVDFEGRATANRRKGKFLVVVVEELLLHGQVTAGSQRGADRRSGAVGGDRGAEGYVILSRARCATRFRCPEVAESQCVAVRIYTDAGLIESNTDGGVTGRLVDEHPIE